MNKQYNELKQELSLYKELERQQHIKEERLKLERNNEIEALVLSLELSPTLSTNLTQALKTSSPIEYKSLISFLNDAKQYSNKITLDSKTKLNAANNELIDAIKYASDQAHENDVKLNDLKSEFGFDFELYGDDDE